MGAWHRLTSPDRVGRFVSWSIVAPCAEIVGRSGRPLRTAAIAQAGLVGRRPQAPDAGWGRLALWWPCHAPIDTRASAGAYETS